MLFDKIIKGKRAFKLKVKPKGCYEVTVVKGEI